jgi:serine/threonine protein phosphatase PrpC
VFKLDKFNLIIKEKDDRNSCNEIYSSRLKKVPKGISKKKINSIIYEKFSCIGNFRGKNEDRVFEYENINFLLFIVADGVTGQYGGEVASSIAIATVSSIIIAEIQKYLLKKENKINNNKIFEIINYAIDKANDTIIDKANQDINLFGMCTTITLVLIIKENNSDLLFVCNLGDSRLYMIPFKGYSNKFKDIPREKNLKKKVVHLSEDHTQMAELIKRRIKIDKVKCINKYKNIITKYLGDPTIIKLQPYIKQFAWKKGDCLVLCSDGLSNTVSDYDLFSTFRNNIIKKFKIKEQKNNLKLISNDLISKINSKGALDDVSFIIIQKIRL